VRPFSAAFVQTDGDVGFGWVGEALVEVWVNDGPLEAPFTRVRDEEGREALGVAVPPHHRVRVRLTWSALPGAIDAPSATFEAEWPGAAAASADAGARRVAARRGSPGPRDRAGRGDRVRRRGAGGRARSRPLPGPGRARAVARQHGTAARLGIEAPEEWAPAARDDVPARARPCRNRAAGDGCGRRGGDRLRRRGEHRRGRYRRACRRARRRRARVRGAAVRAACGRAASRLARPVHDLVQAAPAPRDGHDGAEESGEPVAREPLFPPAAPAATPQVATSRSAPRRPRRPSPPTSPTRWRTARAPGDEAALAPEAVEEMYAQTPAPPPLSFPIRSPTTRTCGARAARERSRGAAGAAHPTGVERPAAGRRCCVCPCRAAAGAARARARHPATAARTAPRRGPRARGRARAAAVAAPAAPTAPAAPPRSRRASTRSPARAERAQQPSAAPAAPPELAQRPRSRRARPSWSARRGSGRDAGCRARSVARAHRAARGAAQREESALAAALSALAAETQAALEAPARPRRAPRHASARGPVPPTLGAADAMRAALDAARAAALRQSAAPAPDARRRRPRSPRRHPRSSRPYRSLPRRGRCRGARERARCGADRGRAVPEEPAPAPAEAAHGEARAAAARVAERRRDEARDAAVAKALAWGVLVAALFAGGWLVGQLQDGRGGASPRGIGALARGLGLGGARFDVVVNSRPPGAWIAVDGKDLARRTPSTLDLPPGEHEVTLSFSDLGSATFKVRGVRGDRVTLDAPLWGAVESTPADARCRSA